MYEDIVLAMEIGILRVEWLTTSSFPIIRKQCTDRRSKRAELGIDVHARATTLVNLIGKQKELAQ